MGKRFGNIRGNIGVCYINLEGWERALKLKYLHTLVRNVMKIRGGVPVVAEGDEFSVNSDPTKFSLPKVSEPVAPQISKQDQSPKEVKANCGVFKFYGLKQGRYQGKGEVVGGIVFPFWNSIKPYIEEVPDSVYRGFDDYQLAENFAWSGDCHISKEDHERMKSQKLSRKSRYKATPKFPSFVGSEEVSPKHQDLAIESINRRHQAEKD
jgi:hypothetical protein